MAALKQCVRCRRGIHRRCVSPAACGCRDCGERLKTEGQEQVLGSGADYQYVFRKALRQVAASQQRFTSEDVTAVCGQPRSYGCHPSTVGALMTAAAKRGEIRDTGRRQKAVRANQHAAELILWEAR